MKTYKLLMVLTAIAFLSAGCSGARGTIKLDDLKYPASMSPYLYGPDFQVVAAGKELEVIGKYENSKTYVGFLWTLLSIGNDSSFIETLNEEIKKQNGDGIVNVKVNVSDTTLNQIPVTMLIPIWPGAAKVKITGDIVRLRK